MDSLVGTYWISPAGYRWVVESEERDNQYRNWVTLRNLRSGYKIYRKRDRILNHNLWVMTAEAVNSVLPYANRS